MCAQVALPGAADGQRHGALDIAVADDGAADDEAALAGEIAAKSAASADERGRFARIVEDTSEPIACHCVTPGPLVDEPHLRTLPVRLQAGADASLSR